MSRIRIGTSGWSYDDWHGEFYPDDLARSHELEYAARRLDTVEINGSFYSLQKPESYRHWYEQAPRGFRFALKGSRFITHNKKLKDIETPLANFFASGPLLLKEKLGPIVWQLAESFKLDTDRLDAFFRLLPRDTTAAARLAHKHDGRMKGRSWTKADRKRHLRHAIEIRNETFFSAEFVQMARRHGVAIVFSDSADWPYTEEITAGWIYIRLHGHEKTYASNYGGAALDRWAERIRLWRSGRQPGDAATITEQRPPRRRARDVYVYFDNDQHAHAPRNALALAERLK